MSPVAAQVLKILDTAVIWASLIPVVVGILRFKRSSYALRSLIILGFVSVMADSLNEIFRGHTEFTSYIPRVYTTLEFTLISIFFFGEITRTSFRYFIITVNVLFIGVVAADLMLQGAMKMDDLSIAIEAIVFLIYSLVFFFFAMRDMLYPNLLATPQFWIIAAIMIYFGGSIFVFVTSNYAITISLELFDQIWGVHAALATVYYILISVGLWKVRKQYQ